MVKIIAVCGNIGAGKSTFINNYPKEHPTENVVQLCEEVDRWQILFKQYYDIIASNKPEYTLEEQCVIAEFQLMTAITRLQQYQKIDYTSNNTYIFERTIQESLDCFLPTLRKYIKNDDIYNTVYELQHELCMFEPTFTEVVYLSAPVEELHRRVLQRNRPGEQISIDYLCELEKYYYRYRQRNNRKELYNNQLYIIGGIGSGKTTLMKKLQAVGINTVIEPLDYWRQDILEKHLKNLESIKVNGPITIWTFIFQCRIIASRLKFRYENCAYERNICEEYYVFIKSYTQAFSKIQYQLITQLYELLLPHFSKGTFLYVKTPANKQLKNISQRARNGEEVYSLEHLQKVDDLYEQMIKDLNLFVYYISY